MFRDKHGRNVIMIVEDTELIRIHVKDMLKDVLENVNVILASNGLEGLENYKKNKNIALIITDIKMPIMSGHTMAGQIRVIEEFTNRTFTPIVALTRYGDEQTKIKNEAVKISPGLDKPILKQDLYKTLKTLNLI